MKINKKTHQSGFSLIELSIVLVIIGLLIVGILAGRELIKASRVQSAVSKFREFDTAVSTFRGKANHNYQLPGDFDNASAILPANSLGAAQVNGNGDGILRDSNGNLNEADGEVMYFWQQLSAVGLLSGANFTTPYAGNLAVVGNAVPRSPFGRNGIGVYGANGHNFYEIGFTTVNVGDVVAYDVSLTTEEAMSIDSKIDDGLPLTGIVTNLDPSSSAGAPPTEGNNCAPVSSYDISVTRVICTISIRMND